MGWDIDVYCHVLVHCTKLIPRLLLRLNRSELMSAKESLLADDDFCEQLAEYKTWLCKDGEQYEQIGDAQSLLKEVDSRFAFQVWLFNVYKAFGDNDGDFIQIPAKVIARRAGIELPDFELRMFDREDHRERLSGLWNVEYDDVYFAFQEDQCFRRVLEPCGQQLQRLLNEEIEVTTWSNFSY
jgi:hypothetical protein